MRSLVLLLLLPLIQAEDSEKEYQERLTKVRKAAAAKHYTIGSYYATSQMYQWAREQFHRAIELDPDHAGARKRLGFKKGASGEWETDPAYKPQLNKKEGAAAERVRSQATKRMEGYGKQLARMYVDLARWCLKQEMKDAATLAYTKAIEFDPGHEAARKALGFEKDPKGRWVSEAERELRREMKEGLAKASGGKVAPPEPRTPVERALAQAHQKRTSEHFSFESPHLSDTVLEGLVKHAEHAYAMYHKIFGRNFDLFNGQRMGFVILKTKQEHERYVDAFSRQSEAHKALAKRSKGMIGFVTETYQESPGAILEDHTVHATAQVLSHFFVKGKYVWLHEGTAYTFTRLIKGTALVSCVDLAGTTPGSDGKNYQDPEDWPLVCKVWVRDGRDPDINAVVRCTNLAELNGAETVKAWSLVDFLLGEHREKFINLLEALSEGATIDAALNSVFGWTPEVLDSRWRNFVKVSY